MHFCGIPDFLRNKKLSWNDRLRDTLQSTEIC